MRLNLSNELTGIKVYQSSPVWLLDKEIATVNLTEAENVSIHEGEYGAALRINEDNGITIFVPFKRGTSVEADGVYTIGKFTAERDMHTDDGVNITKGAIKYMAY